MQGGKNGRRVQQRRMKPSYLRVGPLTLFCLLVGLFADSVPLHAEPPAPDSSDAPLARKVSALLNSAEWRGGFQGVLVQSLADGRTLFERNAGRLFVPASNNKLLTGAAALALLGPNFQYHTRLLRDGATDESGVLHGDLVLRGDGDPLLSSADLQELAKSVQQAGIRRVTGKLRFDESRFDSQRLGDGWAWDDEPFDYSAQISALNLDENVVKVSAASGIRIGALVQAEIRPNVGYAALDNRARTTGGAPEIPLQCDRERGGNRFHLTGGLRKNARREFTRTIANPTRFAAASFYHALKRAGIRCDAKTETYRNHGKAKSAPLILIAEHVSLPLSALLAKMNKPSDNLMAECLLKTIGAAQRGKGSAEAGATSAQNWLESIGIGKSAVRLADGSGLSRYNEVAPRSLVRLLTWLYRSPYHDVFTDSLPIAGVDGTLKNRFRDTAAQNNCRAKTGTLSHASSLSGYVTTADGEPLVFSILMNNHLASTKDCHAVQDKIVLLLASYKRPPQPVTP